MPTRRDRNREILAERLGWPDGAAEEARKLEAAYPDYTVYWGVGRITNPKPGYYATLTEISAITHEFYAPDADGLRELLDADAAARAEDAARIARLRKWSP